MTLEDRIVRLERQNRWMKRVGGGAVALVGLFLTMGQNRQYEYIETKYMTAKIIKVQIIEFVDEDGDNWGGMQFVAGGPNLYLYNKKAGSKDRAIVRLYANGVATGLHMSQGGATADLSISPPSEYLPKPPPKLILRDSNKELFRAPPR